MNANCCCSLSTTLDTLVFAAETGSVSVPQASTPTGESLNWDVVPFVVPALVLIL